MKEKDLSNVEIAWQPSKRREIYNTTLHGFMKERNISNVIFVLVFLHRKKGSDFVSTFWRKSRFERNVLSIIFINFVSYNSCRSVSDNLIVISVKKRYPSFIYISEIKSKYLVLIFMIWKLNG